ncbi:unnamed protein product [Auanema sp. JU1783]|nr:unnamed protein product [Auanema sp. JU1783]
MKCSDLPADVKDLFPKENLEFAHSITKDEAEVLRDVFATHGCFEKIGEMIEAVSSRNAVLGQRMKIVLESNCARLQDLSPAAIEYSKRIIHFVTHVQCQLTLGVTTCFKKAAELHDDFKKLSPADQANMKRNNPDVKF